MAATDPREDIKAMVFETIVKIEQLCETSFPGKRSDSFMDLAAVVVKYPRLLRNFLLYLRTIWKNTKNIDHSLIPYVMKYIKFTMQQLQSKSSLSMEDNEFVVEVFKIFLYLHLESNQVKKTAFSSALLGFTLMVTDFKLEDQTVNVMTQLM
mmetsp:Transcript_21871/g.18791  ORF Transcript_21871/g.18791 Transcript_21871/m.18791 type:complete len:152 (+) Transcript_21871:454-909(+)|eukprot:CAMPEP_0114577382 /NCGR_PEP_ID=MMETSP0125-20121206/2051_1 /TAXON_ID=485358 ORGANISM="Aristerostoma sp., Strain ATCC 50986" /NCGR_SAMPLE_ID=MMETSP0125 /ASSEMBLY_ACC=CAM_ASM_000245 /LENGTH=151 /DNA_ID=CAMNT_0001766655 /DNA_START=1089 /DNA_END=1544 /DNA_ORIENTATION=-